MKPDLAAEWVLARPPILAGGTGDNAAGAVGLGAIRAGDAFVSLGTSGVVFATTDRYRPWPQGSVHSFCHALPGTWHQMGVTLSAAASLAWWSEAIGRPEAALLRCWPSCRWYGRPARRCSCPTSPASTRRTTTVRSAAPSPACRMTPAARP